MAQDMVLPDWLLEAAHNAQHAPYTALLWPQWIPDVWYARGVQRHATAAGHSARMGQGLPLLGGPAILNRPNRVGADCLESDRNTPGRRNRQQLLGPRRSGVRAHSCQ